MRHLRNVLAALRKADETFSLIDPGDRIALGISGGKDSLCLMMAMHLYGKFSGKDFSIVPICLDLGFPRFDPSEIQAWISRLGHELRIVDAREVFPILQANAKDEKHLPCSICSRMKKAAINAAAKEFSCEKVAFAHHKDDAVETLMMNMIHGGRVATFEPQMHLDRANITFIRPLIFARESDLSAMAEEEKLPVMERLCPVDGLTERNYVKKRLLNLYQERPEAEANLANMLWNYKDFGLYFSHIERKEMSGTPHSLSPLASAKQALSYAEFASAHQLPLPPSEAKSVLLLKKDHQICGALAYDDFPHEIEIRSFDLIEEKKEEARAFLLFFLRLLGKKHLPCTFSYEGVAHQDAFFSCGFATQTRESKEILILRYFS